MIGRGFGQVDSWPQAYDRFFNLFMRDNVTHVAVASQSDYHRNNLKFLEIDPLEVFDFLLMASPQEFSEYSVLQLLCKEVTPEGQPPFCAFIVIPLKRDEQFTFEPTPAVQ